jgi:predicted alpha/beta-fold hydrolase
MADGSTISAGTCTWGTDEDFSPPRWLRNPHLQSVLQSLPVWSPFVLRGCREVLEASRRTIVDCGDGVRLLGLHAVPYVRRRHEIRRLAILLHGWHGSADSPDIVSLAQYLFERGIEVIRLNLRDHGDTQDLNLGLFHSCRLAEVVGAVRSLQHEHPHRELSLIGFSLGGNFGLRVGAQAQAAGIDLASVVAICPVVDPVNALARLDSGSLLYRRYFISKWRRSLVRKSAAWPNRYDFRDMLRMSSLTQMAEHFVRRFTNYRSLDNYLHGYTLVGEALSSLDSRTWVVAATDDPILPVDDVDRLPPLPNLSITRTRFGGHCGFYDGRTGPGWLERSIERTLTSE